MDMESKQFMQILRKPKYSLLIIFFLSMIGIFTELSVNILNKVGLDMVSNQEQTFDVRWIILYLVVILISNLLRYFIKRKSEKVTIDTSIELRTMLFKASCSNKNDSKEKLVHLMVNDTYKIAEYYPITMMKLFTIFFSTIIGLGYCFYESFSLTSLLLITLPFIVFIERIFSRRIKKYSIMNSQQDANLRASTLNRLKLFPLIKLYNLSQKYTNEIETLHEQRNRIAMKLSKIRALLFSSSNFICYVSIILALVLGAQKVLIGELTLGGLFAFISVFEGVVWTLSNNGDFMAERSEKLGLIDNLIKQIDLKDESQENIKIDCHYPEMEFTHASYNYGEHRVIEDLNMNLPFGYLYCVRGRSGAGKSSFIKLILEANQDYLTISEQGRKVEFSNYKSLISYVPQLPSLFNTSIKKNIDMHEVYSEEELINELKPYALFDFILEDDFLSMNYGKDGSNCSGGQAQRVAIARALLKKSPIIIMDEPTSSLDKENESSFIEWINSLKGKATIICVTHHQSLLGQADCLLTLENKKISMKWQESAYVQ